MSNVDQCGAICCRVERGGAITVLLITCRETGQWVIPKGRPERKEKPYRCAQREALREAGVKGKIRKKPIGYYTDIRDRDEPVTVSLHLLRLENEAGHFREYSRRQKIWISPLEAAVLVDEPELQDLFRAMHADNPLTSQDKPKRRRLATRPASEEPAAAKTGQGTGQVVALRPEKPVQQLRQI